MLKKTPGTRLREWEAKAGSMPVMVCSAIMVPALRRGSCYPQELHQRHRALHTWPAPFRELATSAYDISCQERVSAYVSHTVLDSCPTAWISADIP
jgi:hypothetical protein